MANYNPDEPDERGYWYDFKITKKVLREGGTEGVKIEYSRGSDLLLHLI